MGLESSWSPLSPTTFPYNFFISCSGVYPNEEISLFLKHTPHAQFHKNKCAQQCECSTLSSIIGKKQKHQQLKTEYHMYPVLNFYIYLEGHPSFFFSFLIPHHPAHSHKFLIWKQFCCLLLLFLLLTCSQTLRLTSTLSRYFPKLR